MYSKYEAVIGLEVHAQLLTDTKIFCGCSTKFGNPPNSNVCPVCMGHPGSLPVLNKKAVEYAVLTGLATNCTINEHSVFARKNYFYHDLPKGYQISQYDEPVCEHGYIEVEKADGEKKKIRIMRIHLEEDAGKSIHDQHHDTLVDLNRCGVPLIEIVTEPDISTPEEAYLYLSKLKQIVTYLGVNDGNMEEGSLRCDANISVMEKGAVKFGTRTEVKNMNSFRNVEKAIRFEIERQIELIEEGGKVVQQTLLWNADINEAIPMRGKEESHDYRYFPDPDLMPVVIDEKWLGKIKAELPELPESRKNRFVSEYGLPEYDAELLTSDRQLADYYEKTLESTSDYKSAGNWVMGEVLKYINENKTGAASFPVSPENLGKLVNLINNNTISGKIAKDIFPDMLKTNDDPEKIVKDKNLVQITDTSELAGVIDNILEDNPDKVNAYNSGKTGLIGFFVGQIMRETKGKANPQLVNKLLQEKLEAKRV